MRLCELEGAALDAADGILDRAAHDVAKYMAATARNVDPGNVPEDLTGRLVSEVCRVDGERPAWQLWAVFAAELDALARDPEVLAISEAMGAVRTIAEAAAVDHGSLVRLCVEASRRITALRGAVRRRRMERS